MRSNEKKLSHGWAKPSSRNIGNAGEAKCFGFPVVIQFIGCEARMQPCIPVTLQHDFKGLRASWGWRL
jgi:hypothetical protein